MEKGEKMKNKIVTLVAAIVFVLLIPTLYSTFFLGAVMDPYGKLDKLPVALIKDTDKNNKLYTKLKDSDIFKFKIVNNKKAMHDLENGDVYGIISFEKDFSKKLTEFPTKHKSPKIHLKTGEGLNYSAKRILTNAINQFVIRTNDTLSKTIIQQFNQLHVPVPDNIGHIVQLKQKEEFPIKNNGAGMAPYIFSLTMFVGAIVTGQFIMRGFSEKESKFRFYYRKQFLFPLIIIFGQVLFLLLANRWVIHVGIEQFGKFVLFLLLTATTFCSIVVSLNKILPDLGSLVVLLLTMLQTSASGGSYPINLSTPGYQRLHVFLPMTYSVDGFRKLMSINNASIKNDIICLLIFLAISQVVLYLAFLFHERQWNLETSQTNK